MPTGGRYDSRTRHRIGSLLALLLGTDVPGAAGLLWPSDDPTDSLRRQKRQPTASLAGEQKQIAERFNNSEGEAAPHGGADCRHGSAAGRRCCARRWRKRTIAASTPNSTNWSNYSHMTDWLRHYQGSGNVNQDLNKLLEFVLSEDRSQAPSGKRADPRVHQTGQQDHHRKKELQGETAGGTKQQTRSVTNKESWPARRASWPATSRRTKARGSARLRKGSQKATEKDKCEGKQGGEGKGRGTRSEEQGRRQGRR